MLYTVATILAMLWVLGLVAEVTLGGFLHFLLLLALAAVIVRIKRNRTPV